jgi:YD repeat-containing protein
MPLPPSVTLQPPFYDPPIVENPTGQQHSQAWTEYHQLVADRLTNADRGTTTADDAAAGDVGEFIVSVASGPGGGISNNIATTVTQITLTAGDWDVRGEAWFQLGSGGAGDVQAAVSLVSGAMPGVGQWSRVAQTFTHTANALQVLALSPCRVSLASPTTVYLVALCGFSSGSTSVYGRLDGRRVR